jgi:hypothetical protein
MEEGSQTYGGNREFIVSKGRGVKWYRVIECKNKEHMKMVRS